MDEVLNLLDKINKKINNIPNVEDIAGEFSRLDNGIREIGRLVYENDAKINQLTQMVNALCQVNGINQASDMHVNSPFIDDYDGISK